MKKAYKWISHHLLLFGGLFLLLYWGYCWGWWGRSSKLLALLFPCACPPISEEFRYPDYIDVLVPACGPNGYLDISPSKRYLAKSEQGISGKGYIYDLATRSIRKSALPTNGALFLTDDIFVNSSDEPPRLVNLENNNISKVTNVEDIPGIYEDWNKLKDFPAVISLFANTDNVYFFPQDNLFYMVGITQSDIGKNIAFGRRYQGHSSDKVQRELNRQGIPFLCMHCDRQNENKSNGTGQIKLFSENGEFYWKTAQVEGMYLSKTNALITPNSNEYWGSDRWVNQDEGIILSSRPKYLIGDGSGGFDVWPTSFFPIPQPVLLLKVSDIHPAL